VTLFFAVLDPVTGTMTYCNAGHNPPLVLRAGGGVEDLRGGGGIVGFDAEGTFESRTCELALGDVVVLFSDGVTETTSPSGEEFGEARLAAAGRAESAGSAEQILQRIDEEVRTFGAGAPPGDDVTLLVVRRTA
jgi:sigma-B regulation protein RsbU (phosphoserine phosphatase)